MLNTTPRGNLGRFMIWMKFFLRGGNHVIFNASLTTVRPPWRTVTRYVCTQFEECRIEKYCWRKDTMWEICWRDAWIFDAQFCTIREVSVKADRNNLLDLPAIFPKCIYFGWHSLFNLIFVRIADGSYWIGIRKIKTKLCHAYIATVTSISAYLFISE